MVQTSGENKYLTHDFDSWVKHSESEPEDPKIHTPSLTFSVPDIIVLELYDHLPAREVKFSRQTVFQRDRHTCQYCAKVFPERDLNLDHVMPKQKGGKTSWDNIVTSCIKCNTRKANKLPKDAKMFPLNDPKKPKWRPLFGADDADRIEEAWADFVRV